MAKEHNFTGWFILPILDHLLRLYAFSEGEKYLLISVHRLWKKLRITFSSLNRHHFEMSKWDAIRLVLCEEQRESTLCLPSSFYTHTRARHNQTLSLKNILSGSEVLPSFVLPVAWEIIERPLQRKVWASFSRLRHPVWLCRKTNTFLSPALRKLYHFPSKASTVPSHCARTVLAN